jgi:lipid II:glycine glycyltransferase (peptidoglycan interpeptide bridge formation enzyme)
LRYNADTLALKVEDADFIRNIAGVDSDACERANSFLQSAFWGEFKSRFGWKPSAFWVDWTGGGRPLLVLSRRLAPGVSFAYVPWGPELPEGFPAGGGQRTGAAAELARKLRRLLPPDTAFIRFDPPWPLGETAGAGADLSPPLSIAPFKRAAADIQPPDTVLVDLTPEPREILAAMKPKWRYNIGLAEKRGVTVSRPDADGLELFYDLLAETARRDGIAIHGAGYYRTLFEVCRNGAAGADLRLYTAGHEGDSLAAVVVLCRGAWATYLYGASSGIKRGLMAPYALQWRAMRDARDSGCTVYDLFGIPPDDDPNHPMAGLYRFKTGFGGKIIHRLGSWDYVYRPLVYGLFNGAEKLRKMLRDAKKNRDKRVPAEVPARAAGAECDRVSGQPVSEGTRRNHP